MNTPTNPTPQGAADYGNEKGVGDGLTAAFQQGLIRREDLFVTSKLWNSFHAKEHVKEAAKRSLSDLGLDYFDLYLIHFPIAQKYVDPKVRYPPGWLDEKSEQVRVGSLDDLGPLLTIMRKAVQVDVPLAETWAAMEELVDEGLAKNIGISNFQGKDTSQMLLSLNIYLMI